MCLWTNNLSNYLSINLTQTIEIKNCDIEVDRRSHSWSVDKNSFTDLYISKVGCNIAAKDANIEIELNLSNQSHLDMFNILKCIKLPNMKRIRIDKLKNYSKEFLQFLTYSMPNNLQLISLNKSPSVLQDAEFYMKGLQRITQVVTKEIYLTCFDFTHESLQSFIKSCVNTSRLTFYCCNFDFDSELDFCGPEYKLEYLCFWCCKCHRNNWNTKPERFERIVKAISESGLKDSLKTLNISSSSNLTADQVGVMLKNYKIEHINISTINSNEPLVY